MCSMIWRFWCWWHSNVQFLLLNFRTVWSLSFWWSGITISCTPLIVDTVHLNDNKIRRAHGRTDARAGSLCFFPRLGQRGVSVILLRVHFTFSCAEHLIFYDLTAVRTSPWKKIIWSLKCPWKNRFQAAGLYAPWHTSNVISQRNKESNVQKNSYLSVRVFPDNVRKTSKSGKSISHALPNGMYLLTVTCITLEGY